MSNSYEDTLDLPHYVSATRLQMSIANRAAQFAPFAALTGYDAAVKETARLTEKQLELDESALAILNGKLQILADRLVEQPEVSITYFAPDTKKAGGAYMTVAGIVKKIDDFEGVITLVNGEHISFEYVLKIEGDLFREC